MEASDSYTHVSRVFEPSEGGPMSDEAQEYAENTFWSGFLKDVEDYDTRLTNKWRADADAVLVFAGLLSATIGIFIIESYKMLSPSGSSSDRVVSLLEQISQQFSDFANGNPVRPQSPPAPAFTPSPAIVCVNCIWLLALMLSTTSALFATLAQHCSHTYLDLPQTLSEPRKRARVRSYLFLGVLRYSMDHANSIAPALINLSTLLFHIGLVIFFFTIYKQVAIIIVASVALFGLTYFMLTILPCLDHTCPYRTPLSGPSWYLWHTLAFVTGLFLQGIVKVLFVLFSLGDVQSREQRRLINWPVNIQPDPDKHKQRLWDGFHATIVDKALQVYLEVDLKALTWQCQLLSFAEKDKIERFIAAIPREIIVHLFNVRLERGKTVFRDHLFTLLRSCASDTPELGVNRHRLSICMGTLHYIVTCMFAPYERGVPPSDSLLTEMRAKLAKLNWLRALCADADLAIRVTLCSICAVLTSHLLQARSMHPWYEVGESESQWLRDVMEWPEDEIHALSRGGPVEPALLDHMNTMNIDAFVYRCLSQETAGLPIVQATSFTEALTILMDIKTHVPGSRQAFEDRLPLLIQRLQLGDHEDRNNIVYRLREMFRGFLHSDIQAL